MNGRHTKIERHKTPPMVKSCAWPTRPGTIRKCKLRANLCHDISLLLYKIS
jgi:hypothetical protein